MAFSGRTIWSHLYSRLEADRPRALTHTPIWNPHPCTHTGSVLAGVAVFEKNKSDHSQTPSPTQSLGCEYRSLNWISGKWPVWSDFYSALFHSGSFTLLLVPTSDCAPDCFFLPCYELQNITFCFCKWFKIATTITVVGKNIRWVKLGGVDILRDIIVPG